MKVEESCFRQLNLSEVSECGSIIFSASAIHSHLLEAKHHDSNEETLSLSSRREGAEEKHPNAYCKTENYGMCQRRGKDKVLRWPRERRGPSGLGASKGPSNVPLEKNHRGI